MKAIIQRLYVWYHTKVRRHRPEPLTIYQLQQFHELIEARKLMPANPQKPQGPLPLHGDGPIEPPAPKPNK